MATFAIPRPKKHSQSWLERIETFNWQDVEVKYQIGSGAFGSVMCAAVKGGKEKVVIKQQHDAVGHEKEFMKEVKLLNSIKGHENIVEFKGVCISPFAIVQEYVRFTFKPFGDETTLSSLSEFLRHTDERYDFEGFCHLIPIVMNDIINGLAHLHQKDIVHRDLKPANILVSNSHLAGGNDQEFIQRWQACKSPIVCKLTDFGESRSRLIQTQTLLVSKVSSVDRGSPVYMAPEILLKDRRPSHATVEDLKSADIWALGMVLFVLCNPDVAYPYEAEIKKELDLIPFKEPRDILEDCIRSGKRPDITGKYARMQATAWLDVHSLHKSLTQFDARERAKSLEELQERLATMRSEAPGGGGTSMFSVPGMCRWTGYRFHHSCSQTGYLFLKKCSQKGIHFSIFCSQAGLQW